MKEKKQTTEAWWASEVLPPSDFEKDSLQLIARLRLVQRGSSREPEQQLELEAA